MTPRSTPQPENALPVPQPLRGGRGSVVPDRLYIRTSGLSRSQNSLLATAATTLSRQLSPKLSGRSAQGIKPYFGASHFGVSWDRPSLWYQEAGIGAFTMRNLAGRVIPMWVDDPTGRQARENPKAKTRITTTGRRQVLIFRKAAKLGQRKRVAVRDSAGRLVRWRDTVASYPGAPGRIAQRGWHESRNRTTGRIYRNVTRPHMGVRWRHPGIVPREFMQYALQQVAMQAGLPDISVRADYRRR